MKAELKPEELRIGNLVIHNALYWWGETKYYTVRVVDIGYDYEAKAYRVFRVAPIEDESNCSGSTGILSVSPIELSEEWLLKAGFENVTKEWYTDKCFRITSEKGTQFDYWLNEQRFYRNQDNFLSCVYYVHHLQNIWHALTGNELIFNHG